MGHSAAAVIVMLLIVSLAFFLPALGGLLLALRCGVRSKPVQAIFAIGTPCLLGYAAFGFYLISPTVGRAMAVAMYLTVAGAGVWLWTRLKTRATKTLQFWIAPALLAVAAAAFSLGIGFLHDGTSSPLVTAGLRWMWRLPSDNGIPLFFANQLLSHHRPIPHDVVPGWLVSDRPPLQTAVYLFVRAPLPITDPHGLWYQVIATFLQSLWAPAIWCFFYAVRLPRHVIACGVVLLAVSGLIIVNSFYAWPKLFPAAFLVLLAACVLTPEWKFARRRIATGIACGLAIGLALLGHDGSAFAVAPIVLLVIMAPMRWPKLGLALAGLGVIAVLLVPWTLFQKYYDPPGTDLAKAQLAGQSTWNSKQSLESAVTSAYGKLSPGQILRNKWSNLSTPFSGEIREVSDYVKLATNLTGDGQSAVRRNAAVLDLRSLSFVNLLPSLGLVALAPFAMALALWRRRLRLPDLVSASRIWVVILLILVSWVLVEFGPGMTVVWQGTFALELLIYAAATIAFWRVSRWLLVGVTAIQTVLGLAIYAVIRAPYRHLPANSHYDWGEMALGLVGLGLVIALPLMAPRAKGVARILRFGHSQPHRRAGVAKIG